MKVHVDAIVLKRILQTVQKQSIETSGVEKVWR